MKHVTVVFKNAIQIEGGLISLDDNEMVLQSLDGLTSTVVPDIKENILFYKINSAEESYEVLAAKPNKTQEDLEHLVKAKGNLNAIERSSIREKLMAPTIQVKKDQYVSRNQPFPRSVQYSEKKVARTDTSFASGLQGMFSKKH